MSRSRASFEGGGSPAGMVAGAGITALSWLMAIQAFLNLQFLPSQMTDIIQQMVTTFNLTLPQVGMIFFTTGFVSGFIARGFMGGMSGE